MSRWCYRDIIGRCTVRRDGIILGVCRGVADHFNLRVFLGADDHVCSPCLLVSGIWPMVFHLFHGLVADETGTRHDPLTAKRKKSFTTVISYSQGPGRRAPETALSKSWRAASAAWRTR
jgi:hypothetical protein